VVNDVNGRPSIVLHDDLKIQAEKNGWINIHVSLSHLKDVACAVVIIER
jgi:holo-[acyl-carrier protein] synthase